MLEEPHPLFHTQNANGLEHPQRAQAVGIGGIFRRLERDFHMALGRQVVDLGRLRFLNDANEIGGVGHVAVVGGQAHVPFVGILI